MIFIRPADWHTAIAHFVQISAKIHITPEHACVCVCAPTNQPSNGICVLLMTSIYVNCDPKVLPETSNSFDA